MIIYKKSQIFKSEHLEKIVINFFIVVALENTCISYGSPQTNCITHA